MAYDFTQYGRPAEIDTSRFNKEMQENIIRGHFNGTPGGVYQSLTGPKENERVQNINNGRDDSIRLSREEYESLLKRRVNDTPQNTAQPQQMNERTQQPYYQEYQQTPPNNNEQQGQKNASPDLNEFDRLMNEAFGGQGSRPDNVVNNQQQQQQQVANNQQTVQPKQEQQQVAQPQPSYEEIKARQELETYSREAGVNPEDVVKFATSLTMKELIDMYKASRPKEQIQQPINLSESRDGIRNVQTNPFPRYGQQKSIF